MWLMQGVFYALAATVSLIARARSKFSLDMADANTHP
jgi:hypothetical protein